MACEASRDRIGVVELGIVEDLSQVTAMERTLKAGAIDYGGRKLTVNLKEGSFFYPSAEWFRAGS